MGVSQSLQAATLRKRMTKVTIQVEIDRPQEPHKRCLAVPTIAYDRIERLRQRAVV